MMEHYNDWLAARSAHQKFLFQTDLAIEPCPDDNTGSPLATLAYHQRSAFRGTKQKQIEAEIAENVAGILKLHNELSKDEEGSALFTILRPDDEAYIADITAGAICRWYRCAQRASRPTPFGSLPNAATSEVFSTTAGQLVIETAAGALALLQAGFSSNRNPASASHKRLVALLAHRGPSFAERWIQGEIIDTYCGQKGYDPESYLGALSAAKRRNFLLNNLRDPLSVSLDFVDAQKTILTTEKIMGHLHWSRQQVEDFFNPDMRNHIAIRYMEPLEGAKEIALRFQDQLSTENLAKELGKSRQYVDELFTLSDRKRLARHVDCVSKAQHIVFNLENVLTLANLTVQLQSDLETVQLIFGRASTKQLAESDDPLARAREVMKTFRETLTLPNLCRITGWREREVKRFFRPTTLAAIACESRDAEDKVKALARSYDTLKQTYDLQSAVLKRIALKRNLDTAHKTAQYILEQTKRCPPDIRKGAWQMTILNVPRATQAEWEHRARDYMAYWHANHGTWEAYEEDEEKAAGD